jgi:hypothetical protein
MLYDAGSALERRTTLKRLKSKICGRIPNELGELSTSLLKTLWLSYTKSKCCTNVEVKELPE